MDTIPLKLRGEGAVTLNLEGGGTRTVKLKFSYRVLAGIEQELGKSMTEIIQPMMFGRFSVSTLAVIMHHAAVAAGERLTQDECGTMLMDHGYIDAAAPLLEPLKSAMTAGRKEVDSNPKA